MNVMIANIFNARSKTVTFAAFILAVSALGSKLLGLYRDRVLAGEFGAGDELDIYYAAFRIPDFLFNVLILGAVASAFIPVFSKYLQKDREEAWRVANTAFTVAGASLLVLGLLGVVFAPFFMQVVAPGFEGDKRSLTILATRIMFISPILFGLSSIFGALLQVFRKFLIYSLAPLFYNIGIIVGALWLTDLAHFFWI